MPDSENKSKLNVAQVRSDFPILNREIRSGVSLVYLDSAATSQKPVQVMDAMDTYYKTYNANIHRGIHTLAEEATASYEDARARIADFIGAEKTQEIIFVRNATEALNLVALSWGRNYLETGDVILLTEMEHHSNLVPWQMLAAEKTLRLEFIPVTEDGLLDLEEYRNLLELQPKLVSFTAMSNVLGTINPVKEIIRLAHGVNAITVVDGAQAVPHYPVNVLDWNVDFLAFSGHKMCGPTGIGVLYGKEQLLDSMPPVYGGGDMIKRVKLRSFVHNDLPHKFEAGTPSIAEAIGLGAAVEYLSTIGMHLIAEHESELIAYTLERLDEVPGIAVFGPSAEYKGGVASFTFHDIHPHDVSQILDRYGVAVRAGHHCAMPLHEKFGYVATSRASLYLYNTKEDVDRMIEGLYKVKEIFN
jgi:cysteine desulfurase/selenocysteine lyase